MDYDAGLPLVWTTSKRVGAIVHDVTGEYDAAESDNASIVDTCATAGKQKGYPRR